MMNPPPRRSQLDSVAVPQVPLERLEPARSDETSRLVDLGVSTQFQ
jgi:hypothetical protein